MHTCSTKSLNVSAGWLKDVNQHDNCSNNIIYYQIYISNNTAILEGVSTTVFMLVLYYTVCCRLVWLPPKDILDAHLLL